MDNNNFSKVKSKSKLELYNRQCWICLQTEFKDEINPISGKPELVDPNEKWLTPCRCKGSTQYVHEECLINWIKLKREMDQKSKLCCPSCQTPYTILIPKKSIFQQFCIFVVNKTNELLKYIPIIIKYLCIGYCIWQFSYFYGKFILTTMFEKEFQSGSISKNIELQEFLFRCFPATLISMLFIPWEFSFLISAAIMQFTSNKEIMITMILLYAVSCNFFSSAIRLVLDYIYTLKLNLGLRNDEKTREQRRLLKLSKSVSFPNARVHINENFISPSSFTLKIHILEETQNPMQANPQVLYVEYEKAIILLAVIKSKILHFLLTETNRNANLQNTQVKHHKKCQSLPPYLNKNFLKDKTYSCADLNRNVTNNFDKLLENNKSVSINNMIDKGNRNSFQCILNTPRSKKYSEMIDSNIDDKLKSSLKNIILSNKENNFMKILNKQKNLYTKLTASNSSLNKSSLSPTKDKKMKNKEIDLSSSNDSLNKPSSSFVSNKNKASPIQSPLLSPSNTGKKNNLSSPLTREESQKQSIDNGINNSNNDQNDVENNIQNNVQNNIPNNVQNNAANVPNLNNRRNREAYLTINITNVNTHVNNLIIKTLALPIVALIIGKLIHWLVIFVEILLKNLQIYQDIEYSDILSGIKTNPLMYTAFGIVIASSFADICYLYYHYSKNIEKQKLIVLNHHDISKKLNNYTSIN
eukprot:jgi/Orpsp1_1/1176354/evm.model.c7180000057299.1